MHDAWQTAMITIARSAKAKRLLHRPIGRSLLAQRFVGRATAEEAVVAAADLKAEQGITSTLFYLGEYVDDVGRTAETVRQSCRAARLLADAGLDVHISIDPTAVGYLTSDALAKKNAEEVGRAIPAQPTTSRNCLMLDMEDLTLLEPTLEIHRHLMSTGIPSGVTLQARLRRTPTDLEPLLQTSTHVRLVKGAFPLGSQFDHQGRSAINEAFVALAGRMLSPEARAARMYPSFATHDEELVDRVIKMATEHGWAPHEYEIECLYGVRPQWQRELRRRGVQVRVYLPFGDDWWAYVLRRVGERPRNLLQVARRGRS
ncbi:MAG TPA: proline dehydrogenase family protein [Micromonosporaceae bacterium]|jgi:proline dehydrogenase